MSGNSVGDSVIVTVISSSTTTTITTTTTDVIPGDLLMIATVAIGAIGSILILILIVFRFRWKSV